MPTMEAVGNGGGVQVKGFRGVGKGERNGRKRYDNWRDIVLVLFTKMSYITCPPFTSTTFMADSPVNQGSISKSDAEDGIFRHKNRKDLGIADSLLF